ncbi:hypothetical protein CLOP_g13986 [Closterium sp. NIES-67]|nr:hypothetical protein CLOP_g13986 [Closterium sp. NIES-67]
MVGMSLRSGMRLPVGETPPLGEENVSPNEGGEEQRGESSEDKRESPREKAGEGAQEEPGHFKRDCPKLQSCTYCQRKGHAADDCYTKQREERSRGGRRSRIEALEEELRKLKGEAEGSEEEED